MQLAATLFNTEQGICAYAAKALGLSLACALMASIVVGLLFPELESPSFNTAEVPLWALFIGIVIFSPVLETLLMWPVIALLRLMTHSTLTIALLSALLWAVLHSLQALGWGFVIFVFSIAFVEWRKRSLGAALGVTMLIHAGQNLFAFVVIAIGVMAFPAEMSDANSQPGKYSALNTAAAVVSADDK